VFSLGIGVVVVVRSIGVKIFACKILAKFNRYFGNIFLRQEIVECI
jgi:hypothetical protein